MNPLIEKFWNDAGYEVVQVNPGSNPTTGDVELKYVWWAMRKGVYLGIVGESEAYNDSEIFDKFCRQLPIKNIKCDVYFFKGQTYLEDEMLKIVKMKAFI